jgi:RNA recognition motif-containing protein
MSNKALLLLEGIILPYRNVFHQWLSTEIAFVLESPLVEVDSEEKKVRSSDNKLHLPSRKRCIIIVRNVPLDATESEILGLFISDSCPVAAVGCERVLESDHSDCWYVTFNSEDDAQNAFLYLTRENISIRGQKVLVRTDRLTCLLIETYAFY